MIWIYKKKIWLQVLHLQSEYSYIFLNLFLHSFHDKCVCRVVQINDSTLRQSSTARLVIYCVWCIVHKYTVCSCDFFGDIVLQTSRSTKCRRFVRRSLVISPTTITCLLCTICKCFPLWCFLDVWSLRLEYVVRSLVYDVNWFFEESLHVCNICRKHTKIARQLFFSHNWKRYFNHLSRIIDWKLACVADKSRRADRSTGAYQSDKREFYPVISQ